MFQKIETNNSLVLPEVYYCLCVNSIMSVQLFFRGVVVLSRSGKGNVEIQNCLLYKSMIQYFIAYIRLEIEKVGGIFEIRLNIRKIWVELKKKVQQKVLDCFRL